MTPIDGELLEVKPEFMGFNNTGYPGAFPSRVEKIIRSLAESPCLHLFSGRSKIGDVRIDLERPEATLNCDVLEFIRSNDKTWLTVVADPPYDTPKGVVRNGLDKAYARARNLNTQEQVEINAWLRRHAENVLWFDVTSPCPEGFYRHKTWLFLPGSMRHIRALTWLKRKGERLA